MSESRAKDHGSGPHKRNGGTDWVVKAGVGAAAGVVISMVLGQFVPQVQGLARLEERVATLSTLAAENKGSIEGLRALVIQEARLTREEFWRTTKEHREKDMHPGAERDIIYLGSGIERYHPDFKPPRRP